MAYALTLDLGKNKKLYLFRTLLELETFKDSINNNMDALGIDYEIQTYAWTDVHLKGNLEWNDS